MIISTIVKVLTMFWGSSGDGVTLDHLEISTSKKKRTFQTNLIVLVLHHSGDFPPLSITITIRVRRCTRRSRNEQRPTAYLRVRLAHFDARNYFPLSPHGRLRQHFLIQSFRKRFLSRTPNRIFFLFGVKVSQFLSKRYSTRAVTSKSAFDAK